MLKPQIIIDVHIDYNVTGKHFVTCRYISPYPTSAICNVRLTEQLCTHPLSGLDHGHLTCFCPGEHLTCLRLSTVDFLLVAISFRNNTLWRETVSLSCPLPPINFISVLTRPLAERAKWSQSCRQFERLRFQRNWNLQVVFIKVQNSALKSEGNLGPQTAQHSHPCVKSPTSEERVTHKGQGRGPTKYTRKFVRTGPENPKQFYYCDLWQPSFLRSY